MFRSLPPCDVTKKEDLENIVKEVQKREKHINLLSESGCGPVYYDRSQKN